MIRQQRSGISREDENVAEPEKDPKFRKWIVEHIGMTWRNYVLSTEGVRYALQNIYLERKCLTKKEG